MLNTLPLWEPDYLSPGEIDQVGAMLLSGLPENRAWDYRAAQVGFARL